MKMRSALCALSVAATIVSLCLASCKKDEALKVCMGSIPSVVAVDSVLTITSCSTNASSVAWDFGDGQMAYTEATTHTYTAVGTYMIKLTATGPAGVQVDSQTIRVTMTGYKVKTETVSQTGMPTLVYTSTYDGQGRLATRSQAGQVTSYSYSSSSVTMTKPDGSTLVYPLNSEGYAISDGTYYFTYDRLGYVIFKSRPGALDISYSIANGNTATADVVGSTATITYSRESDYDTRDFGLAFLGQRDKNLLHQMRSGNTIYKTCTYQLEAGTGKVLSMTEVANAVTTTTTYTYY